MPVIPIEQIIGIAGIIGPIIYAWMMGAKRAGLPSDVVAARIALLSGPILALAWTVTHVPISAAVLMEAALTGLVGSLAAMGVYDLRKPAVGPSAEPPPKP